MINMSRINSIRRRRREGESIASIARAEGVSEPTVRKYLKVDDLSARPPVRKGRASMLDEWTPVIEQWLAEDRVTWRKQRHTATRVWERLRDEHGVKVSLSTVTRKVAQLKREFAFERESGFLDLVWHPGECQADFGEVDVRYRGSVTRMRHFVLDFPYSNIGLSQLMPAENAECTCQALSDIFEWLGGVPVRIVYDNAAGVGRKRFDGIRLTRLFQAFQTHYGFEYSFCNPYSGHEKGSVENAVGFVRRNLMVPMPSAESFQTLTRVWLDECERVAGSDHCRHDVPVIELFEAEKDHMRPLPGVRFDPCDWRSVKADKTGAVTIDANRYLAGPKWRSMRLQAGVRVFEIGLRGPDGETITTPERIWGHSAKTRVDPASLLAIIARKPRIWGESPIRNDFPETVRVLLDRMDARTRSDLLDDIRAVAADCGFAATVKAAETVINAGRTVDRAAIGTCAKRILEGAGTEGGQDLKRYDKYMKEAE